MEAEGHSDDQKIKLALERIENQIIQEPGAIRILGSFPRVDMRTKLIASVGFIGTGDMSDWFAKRLENEGYRVLLSGRTTELTPEEMLNRGAGGDGLRADQRHLGHHRKVRAAARRTARPW